MKTFNKVDSYLVRLTGAQLQCLFDSVKVKYPKGFTASQFRRTAAVISVVTSRYNSAEACNLLIQRFKSMGLIVNTNGVWYFTVPAAVSGDVDGIVKEIRALEVKLLALGYTRTQRATYERKVVSSVTI